LYNSINFCNEATNPVVSAVILNCINLALPVRFTVYSSNPKTGAYLDVPYKEEEAPNNAIVPVVVGRNSNELTGLDLGLKSVNHCKPTVVPEPPSIIAWNFLSIEETAELPKLIHTVLKELVYEVVVLVAFATKSSSKYPSSVATQPRVCPIRKPLESV
jgi:hypothetical protein